MIPITKPSIDKSDFKFLEQALKSKILTDGFFQQKTEQLIKKHIKSRFVALTHSCTAALEISAILINLKKGDEVIMPSYGFVSVANAIVLRGAIPIFAEVNPLTLNISCKDIEKKISKKTKAIYIIHYAGNACEIDKILKIAKKNKIFIIEDTAHAFMAKFKDKFLGTLGDIGVFSFHETKNVISGEGGALLINDEELIAVSYTHLTLPTNREV